MLKQFESKAIQTWQSPKPPLWALAASYIFGAGVAVRRLWYRLVPKKEVKVPILVVGNIAVGGSGKTPVVIALAQALQHLGFSPGIVSRGYKAALNQKPTQVNVYHSAHEVGDEPLLIHFKTGLPVVIGKDRVQAVHFILAQNPHVNVIISDDGMQHYRMPRTIEIALVELKALGNRKLLPAGPLREPMQRLKEVNYRLSSDPRIGDYQVEFEQCRATHLTTGEIDEDLESFKGRKVHAVAGIANPERFFDMLESKGISVIRHVFPDHYALSEEDLNFETSFPILMTEKDAIKCQHFTNYPIWSVDLNARLDPDFLRRLIKDIIHG